MPQGKLQVDILIFNLKFSVFIEFIINKFLFGIYRNFRKNHCKFLRFLPKLSVIVFKIIISLSEPTFVTNILFPWLLSLLKLNGEFFPARRQKGLLNPLNAGAINLRQFLAYNNIPQGGLLTQALLNFYILADFLPAKLSGFLERLCLPSYRSFFQKQYKLRIQ